MKRSWDDINEEHVSMEHEARIANAVASELETNASRAGRRWFDWNLVGGFSLLGIAGFGVFHMIRNAIGTVGEVRDQAAAQSETLEALTTLEVASDFDVVNELDLLESLDDLENWNGVDV